MANGDKSLVKAKKKYHHGDLKGQLLEAVRELIERDGPEGFSIAEACRRAGVSTAAPYKHFKDRTDILRHAVMLAMTRLRAAMQAGADAHDPRDPRRVDAVGRAYVDFARAEPGLFRTMFGLTESHDDPELQAEGDASLAIVERVIAEYRGVAQEAPEVRLTAYALWCFVHGHSFLSLDGKLPKEVETLDDGTLLAFVGAAMLPAPPAMDAPGEPD